MKLPLTRILLALLLVSSAFAAWAWLRPYAWRPDPAARFHIENAQLKRDNSYYWLDLHLQHAGEGGHDLEKPIRLHAASGRVLEPADTTFSTGDAKAATELWLKFWLEPGDLAGPLELQLNDGKLVVKSTTGTPSLDGDKPKLFLSTRW